MLQQKNRGKFLSVLLLIQVCFMGVFILNQCSLSGPGVPDGWKEYRDVRFGYGIMIPEEWQIKEPPSTGQRSTMNITNYDDTNIIQQGVPDGEWPEGALKFDIMVIEDIEEGAGVSDVIESNFSTEKYYLENVTKNTKIGSNDAYTILFTHKDDATKTRKAVGTWLDNKRFLIIVLCPERAWNYPGVEEVIKSMTLSPNSKMIKPEVAGFAGVSEKLFQQRSHLSRGPECKPPDPDDNVGDSPIIPLFMPFEDGTTWTVGCWGSFYGEGAHKGNDYYATDWNMGTCASPIEDRGQRVYPVAPGKVLEAFYDPSIADGDEDEGYGNYVKVRHDVDESTYVITIYAHLSAVSVGRYQDVGINTVLGRVGSSGHSDGPHLHLSFKVNGISRYNTPPSCHPSPMWTTNGFWELRDCESGTVSTNYSGEDPITPTPRPDPDPITPPPAQSEIIVDDGDPGCVLYGPSEYWHRATSSSHYYDGDMYWTYVNGNVTCNYARWTPNIPQEGMYLVEVFITWDNATTHNAGYTISFQYSSTYRTVDQFNYCDQWVSLGAYPFGSGTGGWVQLTDATGEDPNSLLTIGIDAVRWTRQ